MGPESALGRGFNPAAKRVHFRTHHVQANAPAREFSDLGRRRQARRENQIGRLRIGQGRIRGNLAAGPGLFADSLQVQSGTIVDEFDGHIVALLLQLEREDAGLRLARGNALRRSLDAMRHGVAQQMLKHRRQALEHAAVHVQGRALDLQADLLVGIARGLAHDAMQAPGDALKLDHPGAQQIALQLARLARLGNQVILIAFNAALQIALHRGHIVHRFGQQAGELLNPGETIKFQRIKALRGILVLRQAGLHLRFRLHLKFAQLTSQTVQIAGQVTEGTAQLAQPGFHARARDHDFAGLIDQPIQQLRAHAHGLVRNRAHRHRQHGRRQNGRRQHRRRIGWGP